MVLLPQSLEKGEELELECSHQRPTVESVVPVNENSVMPHKQRGVSRSGNTLMFWEGGVPREGTGAPCPPSLVTLLCKSLQLGCS